MKVGDIIRREIHSGSLIGQYIVVMRKGDYGFYGRRINAETEFFIDPKVSYKKLKTVYIRISEEDFNRLHKQNVTALTHDLSTTWEDAHDKGCDILILYHRQNKLYYVQPEFKKIIVKQIVTKAINKREKDIIRYIPKIKVYLHNKVWYE
jgi:hypothetical protein